MYKQYKHWIEVKQIWHEKMSAGRLTPGDGDDVSMHFKSFTVYDAAVCKLEQIVIPFVIFCMSSSVGGALHWRQALRHALVYWAWGGRKKRCSWRRRARHFGCTINGIIQVGEWRFPAGASVRVKSHSRRWFYSAVAMTFPSKIYIL